MIHANIYANNFIAGTKYLQPIGMELSKTGLSCCSGNVGM